MKEKLHKKTMIINKSEAFSLFLLSLYDNVFGGTKTTTVNGHRLPHYLAVLRCIINDHRKRQPFSYVYGRLRAVIFHMGYGPFRTTWVQK